MHREVHEHPVRSRAPPADLATRGPHTMYYKDPREFTPQEQRAREMYRREAPPPAHSHHPPPTRGAPPPEAALQQLAAVAAVEKEQHRPHSEPRDKSPAMFHPADRSQMTPPAPRLSSSPYQQPLPAGQRPPPILGQRPIGQPPPLVNIKSPKMPVKSEKMSPAGGSITAGTPVQPGVRYEAGSISSGTPRYEALMRHPAEAPRVQVQQAPGGSITRGTPVSYEQPVPSDRRTPVSSHDGGPPKMTQSQAAMMEAATREAVARGVPVPHVYDRMQMLEMYQLSQRRISPPGEYPAAKSQGWVNFDTLATRNQNLS